MEDDDAPEVMSADEFEEASGQYHEDDYQPGLRKKRAGDDDDGDEAIPAAATATAGATPTVMSAEDFEKAGGKYHEPDYAPASAGAAPTVMSAEEFEKAGGEYHAPDYTPPEQSRKSDEGGGKQSTLESTLRGAAHAILPTAAAVAAGGLFAGPVGAIGAGLVAGMGAGYAQEKALEKVWPEEAKRMKEAEEQHPFASAAGGAAAFGPFAVPGLASKAGSTLLKQAAPNIVNAVLGGGIDLAISGDPYHAAGTGLVSGAFGRPTALGERLAGVGERAGAAIGTRNEESLSTTLARAKENAENPPATPTQEKAVPDAADTAGTPDVVEERPPADGSRQPSGGPSDALGTAADVKKPTTNEAPSGENLTLRPDGRGPTELGKGKAAREGGFPVTDKPVDDATAAALKPPTAETEAAAAEPRGQYQQQEQPSTLAARRAPDDTVTQEAGRQQFQQGGGGAMNPEGGVPPGRPFTTLKKQSPIDEATLAAMPPNVRAAVEASQRHGPMMQQGQQQSAAGGGGSPPNKPPKAPPLKVDTTPRFDAGDFSTAEKAAQTASDMFHNAGEGNRRARAGEHTNLAIEAGRENASIMGKGGQEIARAIERGEYDKLDPRLKETYEKATAKPQKEIDEANAELAKRGRTPPEMGAPNYVHRLRTLRQDFMAWLNNDPTGALMGMKKPDVYKPETYKGAEAPDGTRFSVQEMGEGKYSLWKDGEQKGVYTAGQRPEGQEGFKNGDKFEFNGKQYTVDRGRVEEITKDVRDEKGKPIRYHENALMSKFEEHQQVMSALDYDNALRTFKEHPNFDPYRTKANSPEGQRRIKEDGWKELHGKEYDDFKGIAMTPDMAQAIKNNFGVGIMEHNPIVNLTRALNQVATRAIFWNPIPHGLNATVHWFGARGEDWLPFEFRKDSYMPDFNKPLFANYGRMWRSLGAAYHDVINQTGALQDLNRNGASLIYSGIRQREALQNIGKVLNDHYKLDPGKWEAAARKYGLGTGKDAVAAVYNGSRNILWSWGDILMVARIHELEAKGVSRAHAIADAEIHIPDYRLALNLAGTSALRGVPRMMSDPVFGMFGRYHSKMINSLAHMSRDAFSPSTSTEDRRKAFGNIGALMFAGTVLYPLADGLLQKITGNKDASFHRRGPLAPFSNIKEALTGDRTYSSAAANVFTASPMAKIIPEVLSGHDWRGKNIIEPRAPYDKQAAQIAEYAAGNLISPYNTIRQATMGKHPPGLGRTLLQQVTDTKVPTAEQMSGKNKGKQIQQRDAKARDKRPQGLIEAGVKKLHDMVPHFNEGGPVEAPVQDENYDYDMDAFRRDNPDASMEPGQHYPDTYKKPNHITFSDESVYHGKDGAEGGHWDSNPDKTYTFTPGKTNLENYTPEEMQDYFKRNEPGNTLNLPKRSTLKRGN